MTLHISTLSCFNKQYNVLIKSIRITILYLKGLCIIANAQVKSYFPKTETAIFTRAVIIILRQFLVKKFNERRNRSFRA